MDERTVYLYARHNGLTDSEAAEFVGWFYDNRQITLELGGRPFELAEALPSWREVCDG